MGRRVRLQDRRPRLVPVARRGPGRRRSATPAADLRLAAATLTGASDAEAYYWFTQADTLDLALEGYPLDPAVLARFVDAVDTIVEGVEQGCFPAVPGERTFNPRVQRETFANCFSCPYDRLCAPDRATAWARKSGDPAVAVFNMLEPADADVP